MILFSSRRGKGFAFLGILIWLMVQSCTHEPFPDPGPDSNGMNPGSTDSSVFKACDTNVIFFNRDILPIFNKSCAIAGCHDKRTAKQGYVFTEYNTIIKRGLTAGRPENSKIYEVISTTKIKDIMPPAPYKKLTTKELQLINRWIIEGLKNDTCVAKSDCDTAKVTFSKSVLPIFEAHCVSCHGSITSYSGLRLHNYSFVKEAVNTGRLMGAIRWEPGFIRMPLDQPQLLGCDIKKLEIWLRNGSKND